MRLDIIRCLGMVLLGACALCAEPHDVAFKSDADGTEQRYMEILPADFDQSKNYELIIGLHGHGSDRRQFATAQIAEAVAFRKFAAKHGMIAVTPDYRAATSWMGPRAEADVIQIINGLKKKYRIGRVFIVGGSMGATSALSFAALHPEMVAGVTSMNGHANHLEYENFQDAIAASFGGKKTEIPLEYKKRSAEYWPEVLTMPIAMTVGANDTVVPPGSCLRLAAILKKLDRKVFVINRPAGGHSTTLEDGLAALEFMVTGEIPPATAATTAAAPTVIAPRPDGTGGIFFAGSQPAILDAAGKAEIGLKFSVEKAGRITAFWFYQATSETGPHTFRFWNSEGKLLLTVPAAETPGAKWVKVTLPEPPAVNTGIYTVSYTCATNYVGTHRVFDSPVARDGITALAGVYSFTDLGEKMPDKTYNNLNYFVDIEYLPQ